MSDMELKPIDAIEKWFERRCNGLWEHQFGLKLETTDNPGWLLTIDEAINESLFKDLSAEARKRWNAECIREQGELKAYAVSLNPPPVNIIKYKKDTIKIYATSLSDCIDAAAYIITTMNGR